MLKPLFTEKSLNLAKEGKYTFLVGKNSDKNSIKAEVSRLFGVKVIGIKTITISGEVKRNNKGMKIKRIAAKKAIVVLKDGDKIDLFEETKKK